MPGPTCDFYHRRLDTSQTGLPFSWELGLNRQGTDIASLQTGRNYYLWLEHRQPVRDTGFLDRTLPSPAQEQEETAGLCNARLSPARQVSLSLLSMVVNWADAQPGQVGGLPAGRMNWTGRKRILTFSLPWAGRQFWGWTGKEN